MTYLDEHQRLSLALDQLAKLAPPIQSPWFQAASEAAAKLAVIDQWDPFVKTLPANFVSMTGTAGVDNTAQTVKTIVLPANTLVKLGERIRVRCYWKGDTGAPITGTLAVNGVTVAAATDAGAASFFVCEAWLHYGDATHANVIAMLGGAVDPTIANNNVAGFAWGQDQNITIAQNMVAGNHIVVFFLAVDIFPIEG